MIALNSNVAIKPIDARSDVQRLIGYEPPMTTESRRGEIVALPLEMPKGISICKVGSIVRYRAFNCVDIDGTMLVPANNLLFMED